MSVIRCRLNGFSAWINVRLQPYDHQVNNALTDLMKGTNMHTFLWSRFFYHQTLKCLLILKAFKALDTGSAMLKFYNFV